MQKVNIVGVLPVLLKSFHPSQTRAHSPVATGRWMLPTLRPIPFTTLVPVFLCRWVVRSQLSRHSEWLAYRQWNSFLLPDDPAKSLRHSVH